MIAPVMVQEVKRLLAEGNLSARKIARTVGVSRGTVAAIAHGTRPDYEALRRDREPEEEPLGPLARCPGCGGLVHVPCRLCRTRTRMARSRQRRLLGPEEPMQLDLRDEHRTRYEEVRARRIREGEETGD